MRNKNFIIIAIGQVISLLGNGIQRFSMSLYLLHLTGSTAAFAKVLAISTVPYILFAPIAGMLSDNVNRKKIMVYLDFFCATLIGAYALVLFHGRDNELIVTVVMFLLSICFTLYGPAVSASIPQIVSKDKLTQANGIISQIGSAVNFLAPILAGMLYGIFGIKIIVVINAISFFISAIMELYLDIPDVVKGVVKKAKKSTGFIRKSLVDMKDSFIYLRREKRVILGIIASYGLCNIFIVPILTILAPYFINISLGLSSNIYGIIEGVFVLGLIIGGLWISLKPTTFSIKKVHYTYIPMILGIVVMAMVSILHSGKFTIVTLFALGGMAIMMSLSLSNVLTLTFIQKEVPVDTLGRVSALSTAVATITIAPGQLLFGHIIESGIPLVIILAIAGVANLFLIMFIRNNVKDTTDYEQQKAA